MDNAELLLNCVRFTENWLIKNETIYLNVYSDISYRLLIYVVLFEIDLYWEEKTEREFYKITLWL